MLKEKLGVCGILKESLKIPYKNPKFILLTFFTSLPLVIVMLLHEMILQTTKKFMSPFHSDPANFQTKKIMSPFHSDPVSFQTSSIVVSTHSNYAWTVMEHRDPFVGTLTRLFHHLSPEHLQLVILYLVPIHLLDLVNAITIVNSASTIYAEEKPINIKEMLLGLLKTERFKGPLLTSLYVLSLNSLVIFGLMWAVINFMLPSFFMVVYGLIPVVLLVKWMEWSAIWNMSIVISMLEQRHGIEALGISGYFSKGRKRCGLGLMLIFFVWRCALRILSVSVGGNEKWGGLVATSLLSCAGNVMKWVVCTVYFYDCKKRTLEKKVDLEVGKKGNVDGR